MSRLSAIEARFVDFIPAAPAPGVLYVSRKYSTATHLCCCGCGNKVVTPLKPGGWRLATTADTVSLHPSIGNWSFPCMSHYWIRENRVVWAGAFSKEEIDEVRRSDRIAREKHFDAPRPSLWQRFAAWLVQLFR